MSTLSELDPALGSDLLSDLPRLPRDDGGPVFAEPWQAQAFALAVKLSEQGHFTWKEWATALASELQAAARRGEPDDGSRYYEHWLAALESLVTAKGLADPTALRTRKEAWAAAYRNTPHGQPVELLQSRAPDARWLLLGLAFTVAMYWMLQQAAVEPIAEGGSLLPPLGFAASAGLGTVLGMRHALEPDHLAAVSTLMTGERSSAKAAWLGAWWGLGHTLTLFTAGALLVGLQAEMPAIVAQALEVCVALLLVGFGVRAVRQGARRVLKGPTHSHKKPVKGSVLDIPSEPLTGWQYLLPRFARLGPLCGSQRVRNSRNQTHSGPRALSLFQVDRWTLARPFLVGAVHGLAGSGALTALVVTTLPSTVTRLAYLMLFGVGSTVGMAALSGLMGWPIARLGSHHVCVRILSLAAGCVSIALGLFWGYPFVDSLL
jgi:nitrile hydratase accessory protein